MMMWTVEAKEGWTDSTKEYRRVGKLTEVPKNIPPQALSVVLARTKIDLIKQDAFKHLNVCQDLYLNDNRIKTIEIGAFNGLISLKKLYMPHNEIEVIKENVFKPLNACEELKLDNNTIKTIGIGAFTGLVSLKKLHLPGNKMDVLKENVFKHLNACEELWLNNNKIM